MKPSVKKIDLFIEKDLESKAQKGIKRKLDLSNKDIEDSDIEEVMKAVANNGIISLNLEGNKIKDEGAKIIAESLKGLKDKLRLDLSRNEIGDVGAKSLLENAAYLEALNLSENNIQEISQTLSNIKENSLKALNLFGNPIKEEEYKKIPQAIEGNPFIQFNIMLPQEEVDAQVLQEVSKALGENMRDFISIQDFIELRKQGDEAVKKDNFARAECFYKKAIDKNPKYHTGYAHLGDLYLKLKVKKYKEAEEAYTEAKKIKKNYVYAHRRLGDLYQELGDNEKDNKIKATENYEKAVNSYREAADNYYDYYFLGKLKLAEVLLKLYELKAGQTSEEPKDNNEKKEEKDEEVKQQLQDIKINYKDKAASIYKEIKLIGSNKYKNLAEKALENLNQKVEQLKEANELKQEEHGLEYNFDFDELLQVKKEIVAGHLPEELKEKNEILLEKFLTAKDDYYSSLISYAIRSDNKKVLKWVLENFNPKERKPLALPKQDIKEALCVTELDKELVLPFLTKFYDQKEVEKIMGEVAYE